MTPIPPAVARHYHAARKAFEREQTEVLLGHVIGILHEIISPSVHDDAGADGDDVIRDERQ